MKERLSRFRNALSVLVVLALLSTVNSETQAKSYDAPKENDPLTTESFSDFEGAVRIQISSLRPDHRLITIMNNNPHPDRFAAELELELVQLEEERIATLSISLPHGLGMTEIDILEQGDRIHFFSNTDYIGSVQHNEFQQSGSFFDSVSIVGQVSNTQGSGPEVKVPLQIKENPPLTLVHLLSTLNMN